MEAELQMAVDSRARTLFIGLLSGFCAGLLNAAFARLLMRLIALQTSGRGSFSIEGTANIFLFGALIGPLAGAIYIFTLYKILAHNLLKGLLFGLILVAVIQVPGLLIAPDFRAELMAAGALGLPVFALMNFAFVLTLAVFTAWFNKSWRKDARWHFAERLGLAVLGLMALLGFVLLLVEMVGRPLGLIG